MLEKSLAGSWTGSIERAQPKGYLEGEETPTETHTESRSWKKLLGDFTGGRYHQVKISSDDPESRSTRQEKQIASGNSAPRCY